MDRDCASCGFHYEREPGYFLGAMFFSYFMCVVILAPTILYCLFAGLSVGTACILAFVQTAPLSPLIFRYSRGLWVAVDIVLSPLEAAEFSS